MGEHDQHLSAGPYRSAARRGWHCPIAFCTACSEAVDLAIETGLEPGYLHPDRPFSERLDHIRAAMHRVQSEAVETELVRAEARRALIRGGLMVAGWVALLLVLAFCLRTAHAQTSEPSTSRPRAIEGGARESITGESAASSPAGRAGAAGSALDRARSLSREERVLALAVAKVAANEASLARIIPADIALIWQTTEAHGETARARLAWLRAHSSCVLAAEGDGPSSAARRGNCRWTRSLTDSDAQPAGWPAVLPWSRYAPRWQRVRAFARRLVSGQERMRPCSRAPLTWGSVVLDSERAIARGLVPLHCVDPATGESLRNDGFVRGDDAS